MSRSSSSLKELKGLREAVLAEEKAKTQALLQNLPENTANLAPPKVVAPVAVPISAPIIAPFDQPIEEEAGEEEDVSQPEPAPAPPPAPARPPSARPIPSRPAIPSSAPGVANRPKVSKDPALIIPLTPKIQDRLQRHVEGGRWSPAELVIELIRVSLHQGYPAIQYGDQMIARAGTYRTFERNPLESVLKIVSGQGVFAVQVNPESQEYQHWLTYFTNQQTADPEKSASQVCLFALQSHLENIEDFKPQSWTKNIPPDAFSVSPSG